MKELLARILLMSDSHCMVVPPWKQKGQTEKGLAGWIVEFFISIWKLFNLHFFVKAIEKIGKMGKFDKIIYCGDLAECVYNERGMITGKDLKEMERFKAFIELGIDVKKENIHYLPGDHELGYILPLSCDPEGGISWKSIDNFQSVFGPLFSGFAIGNFNFLLLSSSLFTQPIGHLSEGERKYVAKLQKDQQNFIWDYFADKKKNGTVFAFMHDPDGTDQFNAVILHYNVLRNRKYKVLCGHMHAEDSLKKYEALGKIANAKTLKEKAVLWIFNRFKKGRKVMNWAEGNLQRIEIFEKYGLQVVPSTAGMMGRGGGFLILNLFDDGSYEIEKHKI